MFGQKLTGWKGVSAAVDGAILEKEGCCKGCRSCVSEQSRPSRDEGCGCQTIRGKLLKLFFRGCSY